MVSNADVVRALERIAELKEIRGANAHRNDTQ
jgi:DNA polymerase/3'-5' exonuclease PolX